jgi:hypothetical protein
MDYRINNQGWSVGAWFVPAGTTISSTSNDHFSLAARGMVPPYDATPLDGESYWAQQRAYPILAHLLGGIDPAWVTSVTAALRQIPPEDFRGKLGAWFAFMTGCKYAGIPLSEFIAWCAPLTNEASEISRCWRAVEPKSGIEFWRALDRRGIKANV